MRNRKLTLKKETLAELGTDDLAQVVGGQDISRLSGCVQCGSDFQACTPTNRCVATLGGCLTSLDVC